MPTTFVLVRHGETDWNREHRFQGHADTALNDVGRAQARELAERLRGEIFTAVYSSPLVRALETAQIVAAQLGLDVQPDASLAEVDVGTWSGLTRDEVEARFPEGYARWLEFNSGWDDGESYDELGERVVAGLRRIAKRHRGDRILVITHGGPIRSALAAADGVPFGEARRSSIVLENCAVARIAVHDGALERAD